MYWSLEKERHNKLYPLKAPIQPHWQKICKNNVDSELPLRLIWSIFHTQDKHEILCLGWIPSRNSRVIYACDSCTSLIGRDEWGEWGWHSPNKDISGTHRLHNHINIAGFGGDGDGCIWRGREGFSSWRKKRLHLPHLASRLVSAMDVCKVITPGATTDSLARKLARYYSHSSIQNK